MLKSIFLGIVIFVLMSCIGCSAPKTYIVLLEDLDGKSGEIIFSNDKESIRLNQVGQGLIIDSITKESKKTFMVFNTLLEQGFGSLLNATPEPPKKFIFYFETGQVDFSNEAKSKMQSLFKTLKSRNAPKIIIHGHTDSEGTTPFNINLSYKRAGVVYHSLLRNGVDKKIMIGVYYHADRHPAIKTEKGVAEPRNRRAEVIIQ